MRDQFTDLATTLKPTEAFNRRRPYEEILAENNLTLPTSPALLELWASRPPAA